MAVEFQGVFVLGEFGRFEHALVSLYFVLHPLNEVLDFAPPGPDRAVDFDMDGGGMGETFPAIFRLVETSDCHPR